jgi:hydroxypyruvate isomerase
MHRLDADRCRLCQFERYPSGKEHSMGIKQSVCYSIFKSEGLSYDTLFSSIAEIGYLAVELWMRGDDFDDVVTSARRFGLAIASMGAHASATDGLTKRSNHDRIEREVKEAIDVAVAHGIPGLFCLSGNRLPYQSELEMIEAVADGLRRVAPYAERRGVNLNLEPLNSKIDHPGYACDHTAWAVAVCERVNSPRVKMLFDIYHMQVMEGDVIRTIQENIRWIGHIHTAGNPGRNDIDDTQELNYPAIIRAIIATGYDGYVGHEFIPKGDVLGAFRKAFELCDQNGAGNR